MRELLDMLPDDTLLCPGWFLVNVNGFVMLDVGEIRLAPMFPTADLARQFLAFCGDPGDVYPDRPQADSDYLLLRHKAHEAGCRGLIVVTGVHPWHALAVSGTGQWTPIPRPAAVEVPA